MVRYGIVESDQFLKDVEEAAVWILISNVEQSEALADKKVDDFERDLNFKNRDPHFSFRFEIPEAASERSIR